MENKSTKIEKSQKKNISKKVQKTVSAKKLPGIFKKKYNSKNLETKLLKKLYIKSDLDFVEKLFIEKKDKKNKEIMTFDETSKISVSDLKKYKMLAKQIKQQKGGIKFIPLLSVIILIVAIGLSITFFKNIIIEKALSSTMQSIFGAKTDIAKVDFQIFNASLEITGLEQANKDSPMKNLFQIDKIKTAFNLTDLLRGKFHAETFTVEGVAIDTERKNSGELPIKPSKSKEEKQTEENVNKQKNELSQNAEKKLKEMFENYNPEKMLDNLQSELKSPTVAMQISTDVQTKVEKWKAVPQELQTSVTTFSNNINTLTKTDFSKINDLAKLKTTLEQINNSIEQGKSLKKTLEKTTSDLSTDSKSITEYSKQIQNAIKADNSLVESKINEMKSLFSPEGLNEIMNNAVQSILYDVCGKYYPYVNKGLNIAMNAKNSASNTKKEEKKTEKKVSKNETKKRLPGRNIFFKEDTVPTFYIENITASGYEYKTNNLLFKGIASYISNDQDVSKKPSTIEANFNINGNPNNASVIVDARSLSSSPLVTASYTGSGFPISTDAKVFELSSKSSISAKLTADKSGNASLNGAIDMNITEITGMQFEPEKVCSIYNESLKNLKKLSIDFTIKINSDKTISVLINNPSKIAKQITDPISKALTGELNSIANDAKNNVTKVLSEKTGVATEQIQQFTNIQSNINNSKNKVDSLQKQLEQKKKQINDQITNAAKSATSDATTKLIKNLF